MIDYERLSRQMAMKNKPRIILDGEEWRDIVGWEGLYKISSYGRVLSYRRYPDGRFLKPGLASHGYPTVMLGRKNSRTLHSLVAEAFIGPCPPGCEVRHQDDDRQNPRADNLLYGTRSANIYDAVERGRWSQGGKAARATAWATRRARYGETGISQ